MVSLRSQVVGERPRPALRLVGSVFAVVAAVVVPIGLAGVPVDGPVGGLAFVVAFGVVPAVAGAVCGLGRLGYLWAAVAGVAPAVAFAVVVVIGSAIAVGTFGGGDSPLSAFVAMLAVPGLLSASIGFVVGLAVATVRE